MPRIRSLSIRLPAIDPRSISEIDQEIVDELESHIAMRTEDNTRIGMSPEAARNAAILRFGDVPGIHQQCRRTLLGERIMWQRIQMGLTFVLLIAVALLGAQFYSRQHANQAAIDDITSALKQLTPAASADATALEHENGTSTAPADASGPGKAYPIKLNAGDVREFKSLSINFGKLKLSGDSITVVPIATEVGVTGAVLIGSGQYTYTPEPSKEFSGHFHGVMLRFNPKDAEAIIKLSTGNPVADKGAIALAKAMLGAVWSHCWYADPDALIPGERAIAADVFSQELGDVLFSGDDKSTVVYNFTERRQLYEKF